MDKENLVFALGTSFNYFTDDGLFDLFIIINEPNEDDYIDKAIDYLDTVNFDIVNFEELHKTLEQEFFPYGIEMLIKKENKMYENVKGW